MNDTKELKEKLDKLEAKRERNVNRYILPLDVKITKLRKQINDLKP